MRIVNLCPPAEDAYCEFVSVASSSTESMEDLRALDHLFEVALPLDPSPTQYMLAGTLNGMRRITVRGIAVCYATFFDTVEVFSIVRILGGQSGRQLWNALLASGQHEAALKALGLQHFGKFFTPIDATPSVQ